jgi:beta-glucosidase
MSWPAASFTLPKWTLAAFARPFLTAGQSACVRKVIKAEQMAVWISDQKGFGYIPGMN